MIIPTMGTNKKSLSNILFSQVQQHVLRLLYLQPNENFNTNEIIRLSQIGTGSVQRALKDLSHTGLITVKKVGNQMRYQANTFNPIYFELRGIVLKTFGLAEIIKEALQPIEQKIDFAFIYGSIAKQEDTAESDIDLMIISDTLTYSEIFNLLEKAEEVLKRKINPTFYSTLDWLKKYHQQNHFITQIIKQNKIFLIGNENEFGQLK